MSYRLNVKYHRSAVALLLLLVCVVFFLSGIHRIPVTDQDEARFAQASKQMLEDRQLFAIYFQNTPRHLKPPGIYWAQAAAVKLTQDSPYQAIASYRLPSVIGASAAVLLLFYLFSSIIGNLPAFAASLLLASSLLLVIEAHLATADALLLMMVVGMQGALYRVYAAFRNSDRCSLIWPSLFWLFLALGVLIKGVTPIYGGLTVIGLCLVDRNLGWLKKLYIGRGLLLAIAFTVTWLLALSSVGDSNFLWDMIHQDLLPKIISNQQGHGAYPGYYLLIFTLVFWPGSLLILNSIATFFDQRRQTLYRFLLVWLISVWLILSLFVRVKLPEYSLPLFPALALLAACSLLNRCHTDVVTSISMMRRLLSALLTTVWWIYTLAFAIALMVVTNAVNRDHLLLAIVAALLVLLTALLLQWSWLTKKLMLFVVGLIVAAAIFYVTTFHFLLPSLSNVFVTPKVKQALQQQHLSLTVDSPLFASDYVEPSLVFLLGTKQVVLVNNYQQLKQKLGQQLHRHHLAIALFAQSHRLDFLQWARHHHWRWQLLSTINGFNYERGHSEHLLLVAVKY